MAILPLSAAQAKRSSARPRIHRHDSAQSFHEFPKPLEKSSLLALPAEIRLQIYTYLIPPARLSTVIAARENLGVSSVSHRPPPLALLLTNSTICAEALETYYRTATFEIEGLLDSANVWPLWQVERLLLSAPQLSRIRRVSLNLYWHRVPGGGVESDGADAYAGLVRREVRRRAERVEKAVDVLLLAEDLREVVVSWKELKTRSGDLDEGFEARRAVLEPLGKLSGLVKFRLGDCVATEGRREEIAAFVGELDRRKCFGYAGNPITTI